ncbi:hypothetical protein E3P99_03865 [Wallemia hederae]|uniref:Velvet domain-containing protein n=1 Tax=Wallemia hederae TaxID=1540922 RepID=A0A4T0FCP2_9BASI|nr:hypothetical protein E3P99_03865 [Wallemia hederae]
MRSPFWVVQCLLHGDYENPSHYLQGQLTASAAYVTPGWAHEAGCYFAFNDLALSTPGVYQLRFLLTTVRPLPIAPNELPVVAEARSQSVTAYTQRSFPGVAASTDLAKSLAEQIMTISIRNVQQRS